MEPKICLGPNPRFPSSCLQIKGLWVLGCKGMPCTLQALLELNPTTKWQTKGPMLTWDSTSRDTEALLLHMPLTQ